MEIALKAFVLLNVTNMTEGAFNNELNLLKREIKRAKLFEIQRVVRRIKQLAIKKGTESQLQKNRRKVERFEKELEFIKNATFDEISRSISRSQNLPVSSKDPVKEQLNMPDEFVESDRKGDLYDKAIGRIINSKTLQAFLKNASEEGSNFLAKNVASKKEHKTASKMKNRYKKAALSATKDILLVKSELHSQVLHESREKDSSLVGPSNSDKEEESFHGKVLHTGNTNDVGSCFISKLSVPKPGKSKAKIKDGLRRGKNTEKGKQNRMGQRARQKMYEKIHGKNAKHLQKTKSASENGNKSPIKFHELKTSDKKVDVLHPSWEATRKRRLLESANIEFKGKKIRFNEDSE